MQEFASMRRAVPPFIVLFTVSFGLMNIKGYDAGLFGATGATGASGATRCKVLRVLRCIDAYSSTSVMGPNSPEGTGRT
jgi:hypothetical protein